MCVTSLGDVIDPMLNVNNGEIIDYKNSSQYHVSSLDQFRTTNIFGKGMWPGEGGVAGDGGEVSTKAGK